MGWAAGIVAAVLLVVVILYYVEFGAPPQLQNLPAQDATPTATSPPGVIPPPTATANPTPTRPPRPTLTAFLERATATPRPTATPTPFILEVEPVATPFVFPTPERVEPIRPVPTPGFTPAPQPTPSGRIPEVITVTPPTPTAPQGGTASRQTWSDRWVEFSVEPHVCGRTLEFRGRARDGARVEYRAGAASPFSLYQESALGVGFGNVAPLAGYIQPAPAGSEYPPLPREQIVADFLTTTSAEFRLKGGFPEWLGDPEDVVLGVWGTRPDYGLDGLRLIEVQACQR